MSVQTNREMVASNRELIERNERLILRNDRLVRWLPFSGRLRDANEELRVQVARLVASTNRLEKLG